MWPSGDKPRWCSDTSEDRCSDSLLSHDHRPKTMCPQTVLSGKRIFFFSHFCFRYYFKQHAEPQGRTDVLAFQRKRGKEHQKAAEIRLFFFHRGHKVTTGPKKDAKRRQIYINNCAAGLTRSQPSLRAEACPISPADRESFITVPL